MRSRRVLQRRYRNLTHSLALTPFLVACARPAPNCASLRNMKSQVPEWEEEYIRGHPALISSDEAQALAVRFLRDQGYTAEPPTVGPQSIRRDIMEAFSFEETLKDRRNTVDPTPVGLCRRAGYWLVAFALTDEARTRHARAGFRADPSRGRGVVVAIDGRRVQMRHQDLDLRPFDP